MGEPATQPSLSPLTELNELSILSVLEENSWERPEGGGGGETKAKNLAPTWTAPRLLCSPTPRLHPKEVDPETPLAQLPPSGGLGGWLSPEVRKAEGTVASAFHVFPSILPASSLWV